MFKKDQQPKAVNFLDSVYSSSNLFANAYVWLVQIGKYLLIVVQIVALGVFFSRFLVDRKNNNLTEEINNKVVLLSNESWRKNAILFDNYQTLLADVKSVRGSQEINSTKISELISGVPSLLSLESFSFNEGEVSLLLLTYNLDTVKNYESTLKNNPDYQDVKFAISMEGADISVRITFNLNPSD